MFRIVCDPSSGSKDLYLTEIRSGSLTLVVCLVGIWQRIPVKYSYVLPDDGSHTIRNMLEWFLILCLLNFYTT